MKVLRLKIIILIPIFCLLALTVHAQEIVYVHTDKQVVVTGESICFKACVLNGFTKLPASESRILYLQLTDPVSHKNLVYRSDIDKKGNSCGEITIPDTLNTGYYLLNAYTNGMRNFNPDIAYSTRILVINQAKKIPEVINSISFSAIPDSIVSTKGLTNRFTDNLDIRLNKKEFAPREKVTLELKKIADSLSITNVSVTVTRLSPFGIPELPESTIGSYLPYVSAKIKASKKQAELNPEIPYCTYPVESKGFVLSGFLMEKTTRKPLKNTCVLLSVPDSVANLNYGITDTCGKFSILLDNRYNNRELILLLKDSPVAVENTTIVFENKELNPVVYTLGKYSPDETALEFLKSCQQLAMVNKIYTGKCTSDSLNTTKPIQHLSFFGKPDEVIKPADFLDMPNLEDIVANIVRDARFKVTETQSTILVADKLISQFWDNHNALVLLNNIPIADYGILKPLGTKQIDRIELKTNRMYYGDLEVFGVFAVFTKENYIPLLKSGNKVFSVPNKVLNPVTKKASPDYSLQSGNLSQKPDFRQTLYWNSGFELTNTGNNTIEFYTSDLKTSYEIVVQGISQNGVPVSAHATFDVR